MMLTELFVAEHVVLELSSHTKTELFREMADLLAGAGAISDPEKVVDALFQRESVTSTQIAPHIALPHASIWNFGKTVGAVGISRKGIDYGAKDGSRVHVVIMVLDERYETDRHLQLLKAIAKVAGAAKFVKSVLEAESAAGVVALLSQAEKPEPRRSS